MGHVMQAQLHVKVLHCGGNASLFVAGGDHDAEQLQRLFM
jgi:hypothetical protein